MQQDSDDDRVRRKAHELWEAEGRPHGRDEAHWIQAREIIAIEDSQAGTLLPRDSGSEAPIEEPEEALRNLADFPNLTDQGENLLTSTDREPSFGTTSPEDMPSVEVPTSGQPGVRRKATAKEPADPAPVAKAGKAASKAAPADAAPKSPGKKPGKK